MRRAPERAPCGDSQTPLGNSQTPSVDSQTVFGNSQIVYVNSQMVFGNSRTPSGNSRTMFGDSQMTFGNSRTPSGNSRTMFGDSQMTFGNSQAVFGSPNRARFRPKSAFWPKNRSFRRESGALGTTLVSGAPPTTHGIKQRRYRRVHCMCWAMRLLPCSGPKPIVADHLVLKKDVCFLRAAADIVDDQRGISRFLIGHNSYVRDPAPEIPGNDVSWGICRDIGLC